MLEIRLAKEWGKHLKKNIGLCLSEVRSKKYQQKVLINFFLVVFLSEIFAMLPYDSYPVMVDSVWMDDGDGGDSEGTKSQQH